MRRIKLVVALAAAMVVLMMAAAPAMANGFSLGGSNGHSINPGGSGFTVVFSGSGTDIDNGFDAGDFVGIFSNPLRDIDVNGADFTFS